MRRVIATVIAAGCAAFIPIRPVQGATAEEAGVVAAINAIRASRNLSPLALHPELDRKADDWAAHLAATGILSHSRLSDGITVEWSSLAENVVVGPTLDDAEREVESSAVHFANVVNPGMTHIGVGIVAAGGETYLVEEFMQSTTSPTTATAPDTTETIGAAPSTTAPAPDPSPASTLGGAGAPAAIPVAARPDPAAASPDPGDPAPAEGPAQPEPATAAVEQGSARPEAAPPPEATSARVPAPAVTASAARPIARAGAAAVPAAVAEPPAARAALVRHDGRRSAGTARVMVHAGAWVLVGFLAAAALVRRRARRRSAVRPPARSSRPLPVSPVRRCSAGPSGS